MTEFDFRELDALAVNLGDIPVEAAVRVRAVFQEAAGDLKNRWRENAKQSAGTHGRLYPNSITYSTTIGLAGIEAEIGPESGRPQGGMGPGFEFGSVNQPAHLDGQRAADEVIPHLERRIMIAAEDVFGSA